MKLLFIGDSLIEAYRVESHACLSRRLGCGWVFLAMADLMAAFPDHSLEPLNRGIPGNRLRDVAGRWEEDCLAHAPQVVTLGVGANDTRRLIKDGEGDSVEAFHGKLGELFQETRRALPGTRLFFMEPFLVPTGQATPAHLADIALRAAVAREVAREAGVVFVELGAGFRKALDLAPAACWAYDGIHPTPAGHRLVADAWLEAFGTAFPEWRIGTKQPSPHA